MNPRPRFIRPDDLEVLHDTESGLSWSLVRREGTYMELLALFGHSPPVSHQIRDGGWWDWRIPSVRELQSLVFEARLGTFPLLAHFGRGAFWSKDGSGSPYALQYVVESRGAIERRQRDSKEDIILCRTIKDHVHRPGYGPEVPFGFREAFDAARGGHIPAAMAEERTGVTLRSLLAPHLAAHGFHSPWED